MAGKRQCHQPKAIGDGREITAIQQVMALHATSEVLECDV